MVTQSQTASKMHTQQLHCTHKQMQTKLVRHVSFMRHFKKYADCIDTKYVAEIWYRIA